MTLDSIIGALIFVGSAMLFHSIIDTTPDVWRFMIRGFFIAPVRWARVGVAMVSIGSLCFGVLAVYARLLPVRIDPHVRQLVTVPAWVFIVAGYIVWQSMGIARVKGPRVANLWMATISVVVVAAVFGIASLGVFHAPPR